MESIPYDKRSGKIWFNGKTVDWKHANIHILNHGLHYASCVFEGERVYDGEIFKLEEHTERLFYSAKRMGIKIPYHSGLKGHSDGDVIIHAIIDSLLGAMRKKDIGTFFPDNQKKYKNIRSSKMLKPIMKILNNNDFYINNLDINLICEQPKVSKYRNQIIKSLSNLLNIDKELINLKGKTVEKLGLIGKEKAIACEVICSITQ